MEEIDGDMVTVFIEGSSNDKNGNLRQGFGKLFEQKWKGHMPKIILGDDKHSTIRKFKGDKGSKKKLLLIDLDANEDARADQIQERYHRDRGKRGQFALALLPLALG